MYEQSQENIMKKDQLLILTNMRLILFSEKIVDSIKIDKENWSESLLKDEQIINLTEN